LTKSADVIFIHPPSVFDFRKKPIFFGPMADLVPSSHIFDMYPIGFVNLGASLEEAGFSTRIVNLAALMLLSPKFDVCKFISALSGDIFCIDLHWLPHAQGALEVASVIKKIKPGARIILGGYSASYYHEELIRMEQVDYVIRGDSAEEPLCALISSIKNGKALDSVANLTWKSDGEVVINDFSCGSLNLNQKLLDYFYMIRMALRNLDFRGVVPFANWRSYPVVMAESCRGCTMCCVTCGGSAFSSRKIFGRSIPAYLDPELLARQLLIIARYFRSPIFLLGDINQAGRDYVELFFRAVRPMRIKNPVMFEFFNPPPENFFELAAKSFGDIYYEMSIDSHEPGVREMVGKFYSNVDVKDTIAGAFSAGARRFDLYFMIGLPNQTFESVIETPEFCQDLYLQLNGDRRLFVFTSAVAPFVDPGSRAFEEPERYGYRLRFKSLAEHAEAMLSPSWKYMLNYDTAWMSRDKIVESTYMCSAGLNRLKGRVGCISEQEMISIKRRIEMSLDLMNKIDDIYMRGENSSSRQELMQLKPLMDELNNFTIINKYEISMKTRCSNFVMGNIIHDLMFGPKDWKQ
jgi:B12-binding domain/radical SAM domain protein